MEASLTDALEETLAVFEGPGDPLTTVEVADRLDLGRRSAYARLDRLADRGLLETKKVGSKGRVWYRSALGSGAAADEPLAADILGNAGVGVFVLDEAHEVVWVNGAAERYFDLDREAVVGADERTLVDDHLAPVVADGEEVRTALTADEGDVAAQRFTCHVPSDAEGTERWLERRRRPIESGAYAGGSIELYYDATRHTRLQRAHEETREELDSLVDAVEEYAIFSLDAEGHIQTWNAGAERIKGYTAREATGEHFSTFYTEADREADVPERNLAAAAADGSVEDEGWRVRSDGSTFWASVTISAVHDADGDVEGYVKVTQDMTERKRAERERRLLYETTRDIAEADTVEEGLNATLESVCAVTGWPYAEAWKPTESGVLRRADAEYVETAFEAFAAFSEGVTFEPGEGLPGRVWASEEPEWMADLSDGSPERYPRLERALEAGFRSSFGVPILSDGEVVAVITFLVPESREDDERLVDTVSSVAAELGVLVTRRRLEERIARERDLVDRMLETSPVGIAVLDAGGEYTRINDRAREVVGTGHRTPADLAFRDPDGERVAPHEHPDSRVLATGEPVYDWEARVESTDGSERWLSVNAVPVLDADGEVERVVMALEDVTRLKRQARRLERQHEALRGEVSEVFDRLSDGLFGLDSALRFTFANDRAAELLDRKPATLVGSDVRDVIGLTERLEEAFHEARSTQESVSVEEFYPALEAWFETRIYPSDTGLSVYFRDVTERKQQERALEESRRRYRTLVENFPNGAVSLVDREVRYVVFGGTPLDANAPSPAELEGSKVAEVLSPPAAETLVSRYEAALEGEAATFEMTVDDRSHLVRTLPVRDDEGEVFAAMGMSQDITERKRLERERENRLRQQAVVADLGQRALERSDIDGLLADAVELVAETLDNEYAKVLELDADADGLLLREGVGWDEGLVGSATVSAVEDDSQAAHTLAVAEPVVVTDLGAESRFSGPDLLRAHDVRSGISVIIGPPDDPWGILGTHDTSRKRPSEHDANFVQSVANVLSTAIDRMHYEWELERQHMQLAVLNNLAGAIRDISGAVIEQSTRTEIEETVCERLADSSSYLFAWVADVDPDTQEVNVRAEAGTDGYLEGMTISVDPDDEHGRGPTGRAFRTGEVAVAEDVRSDSQHDPWREAVETHDVRSSAAIPVAHEGVVYGVLNVYSNRVNAFTGEERTAIASLGEVVGHAIAATERKRALTSDELIELEFRATDVFAAVDAPVDPAGTITFEHAVPLEEGMFLVYGTATPDAADVLRGLAAELPTWETITFRSEEGDEDGDAEGDGNGNATEFELRLVDPPVLSAVASVGGDVDRIVIEGDDLRMQVHLAPSADVRRVIDIVEDTYPNAELLRRQQVTRSSDGVQSVRRRLVEDLTDKQRTALDVAYRSGFFEWPREVTGEDVAESLDVSAPTFHQHLRKAERKVLGTLFATDVAVAE